MSKNDKKVEYIKDSVSYIVIEKINSSGEAQWTKEIPKDVNIINGSGAHIIYNRDNRFHYDVYTDGTKTKEYKDVLAIGSVTIDSGINTFHKSPEQDFIIIPLINFSPQIVDTKDNGGEFIVSASCKGIVYYVIIEKNNYSDILIN